MDILSIPIITAIVYGIMEVIKTAVKNNEKFKNYIPLISSFLGGILGIIAHFSTPGMMPSQNVFSSFLIGFASGLSATGSNQIGKQIIKRMETKKLEKIKDEEEILKLIEEKKKESLKNKNTKK